MPSVVSMPPNIITAAFATTCSSLSVVAASLSSDPPRPRLSWTRPVSDDIASRGLVADVPVGLHLGDGGDDRGVPPEHGVGVGRVQTEHLRHHRDRQRTGELAAQLGMAAVGEPVHQPGSESWRRRRRTGAPPEPGGTAPRTASDVAVCSLPSTESMLRPDDAGGREARVVDGERAAVAHDAYGVVVPGHQPAVERTRPRQPAMSRAGARAWRARRRPARPATSSRQDTGP